MKNRQEKQSSCVPIFVCCRKPSGHADKEVMAATVLTSLSTSPLVLYPSSAPTGNTTASESAVALLEIGLGMCKN